MAYCGQGIIPEYGSALRRSEPLSATLRHSGTPWEYWSFPECSRTEVVFPDEVGVIDWEETAFNSLEMKTERNFMLQMAKCTEYRMKSLTKAI
jgi:hypothetical protein